MGETVKVYIYDLSKGMARSMSQAFLGKHIDGIWHTGIVVFGQEFYFGGLGGIESCNPGGLQMLGQPDEIVVVGETEIPFEVFMDHLRELATTTFRGECYHLLDHNCNTFSNELALFLTGNPIPSKITSLPQEVLSTPFGAMIRPMLDSMQVNPGGHQMFPDTSSLPNNTASSSGAAATSQSSVANNDGNKYFPKTSYLTFDSANVKAILDKLKEFREKTSPEHQVREVLIDQLEGIVEGQEHRLEQFNTLHKLLQWPADIVFPVLDILRLSIRFPQASQYFCGDAHANSFLDLLLGHLSGDSTTPANQMLVLRTLCNTFQHSMGEKLLLSRRNNIIEAMLTCHKKGNKNIQIAASSLLLNFAVAFHKETDSKAKHRCLSVADQMVATQEDPEANFRLLVCLGTLLHGDKSSFEFFKYSTENMALFTKKCLEVKESSKVKECAECLVKLVKSNPV